MPFLGKYQHPSSACTPILFSEKGTAMGTFRQEHLLKQLELQVSDHLDVAVSKLQNLSEKELNTPSFSGGWSIAECLWHLNSYGDHYHPQIASAIRRARPIADDGMYRDSWLGGKFARMMDPTTGKWNMKAFKAHVPPSALDGHAEVAEFIRQQEQLLMHLRAAHERDLRSVNIPISIMRWLKLPLGDVFRFLIAHDRRHVEQAKRNLVP